MRADLHLHSTASDGLLSPAELMRICAQARMEVVALTDHDTLEGLGQARDAAREHRMDLLSGIELSVSLGEEEIHLLGYGLAQVSPALQEHLGRAGEERRERAAEILRRLRSLGLKMEYDEVASIAGGVFSRAHIAYLMREKGMVQSVHEAFAKYLGPGCPAYIPRRYLPMERAIGMLRESCAVPVWAHAGRLSWGEAQLGRRIEEYREMGLAGLEVYHPSHSEGQMRFLRQTARRLGLLVTGGSDYHGKEARPVDVGQMLGLWTGVAEDVQALCGAIIHQTKRVISENKSPFKEE